MRSTELPSPGLLSILERLTTNARARFARDDDAIAILRAIIRRVPVAALVANNSGEFVAMNAAATTLTGYSAAELRRLSMWQITPTVNARDAETLWRAFLATQQQTGDYRVLRHDGTVVQAMYAARAHVLPGLHVSLLQAVAA